MKYRKLFSFLILFLFAGILSISNAQSPCSPVGADGDDLSTCGPSGSSCPEGKRCAPFGYMGNGSMCYTDSRCPGTPPGLSTCSPDASGCDAVNCGPGRECQNAGGSFGWHCVEVAGSCGAATEATFECSAPGCDHGCGVGRNCVYMTGFGSYCVNDASCSVQTCNSLDGGCDPEGPCGPGYRCQNYHCVVDPTCVKGTIDVPYTGPKIRNFSTIMAAAYNLLFPASILFGALMIIVAGYKLMMSEGDPRKTKEGQEDLSSAVLGTAFVVLSAALLRIIIAQILGGSVSL